MNINVSLQKITPEMATKYLQKNKKNRHLNDSTVQFYLTQMHRGQWQQTGETIKFSKKGMLLDGQHRLSAIVKYGKPVDCFVAEGLDEESFKVIDTGKSRSAADVVSMTGAKNVFTLSGAVKSILLYKSGKYHDPLKTKRTASNTDILEYIEKHKNLHEQVAYCCNLYYQFKYIPGSALACLYHLLSQKNATKAEIFFSKYATGIDLSEKSPIRALRVRLMRDSENKSRLTYRGKLALMIHAWNAYLKGKELGAVQVHGKDFKFPTPI